MKSILNLKIVNNLRMALDTVALAELRSCFGPNYDQLVKNGLTDVDRILRAVSNHIAAIHPPSTKSEGSGGAAKSTARIPILEEATTERQWAAWRHRFDCYCVTYKLSDKDIENCVFETIPSILADQFAVDLSLEKSKDEIIVQIKSAVV